MVAVLTHAEQPVVMVNDTIWLEEGTQSCPVTVIRSHIEVTHPTWQKNETEIHEHERHLFSEKGVTFNDVERDDIGNYSLTANMSCHGHLEPRQFVGNFSLNIVCRYLYHTNLVLDINYMLLQFRWS